MVSCTSAMTLVSATAPCSSRTPWRRLRLTMLNFMRYGCGYYHSHLTNYPRSSKAAVIALTPMKEAKGWGCRWRYGRTGRRVECMQVPPVPSREKRRLSLPPHKSVLVDRLCVLLAKDRTIHMGEKFYWFKIKLYQGQLTISNIKLPSNKSMSLC